MNKLRSFTTEEYRKIFQYIHSSAIIYVKVYTSMIPAPIAYWLFDAQFYCSSTLNLDSQNTQPDFACCNVRSLFQELKSGTMKRRPWLHSAKHLPSPLKSSITSQAHSHGLFSRFNTLSSLNLSLKDLLANPYSFFSSFSELIPNFFEPS